jgi:acyl-CoA synthetase (AMP-forming)/AMP-acid ligase II
MDPLSLLELGASPDATVIVSQKGALTRGEALLEAAEIAAALERAGAAGAPVVVSLDSGPGFLASVVGAWMAGCTPVLLDPLVRRELGRAVQRTEARAVIRSEIAAAADGASLGVPIVSPRGLRAGAPMAAPGIPEAAPLVHLYTSGSTGEPAIVAKSFEQLVVEHRFYAGLYGERLRVATLAPWCHILGFIVSFLVPIRGGGRCDLVAGISPRTVLDRAAQGLVDVVVAVPAILRVMVRLLEHDGPVALPSTCRFCVSGAPLSSELRRRFTELTGARITDVYGSTEAGGIAFRDDDGPWRAEPHVEWRIADGGLLEVRSPSVSGTVAAPGAFYGTGDLARAEGVGFALEGRADDVVKIGGRRVSLDEIRLVLETFPGVGAAAVAVERVRGEERLVAFVEAPQGDAAPEAIKAFVRSRLADYKVPRAVHAVRSFPTNTGGKIDRQRLLAGLAEKG